MFDKVPFCIWDDVVGYEAPQFHEQIDIFLHIYMSQPLQTDDKVLFYIWNWKYLQMSRGGISTVEVEFLFEI